MTTVEIIGIAVGILSLVIGYIALKKDHYSKPTQELDSLKLHFNMTKTLSENVQQRLQHYIHIHNAADDYIFFRRYI